MRSRALLLSVAAALLGAACGPPPHGVSGGVAPSGLIGGSVLREDRAILTRGTVVRSVGVARRWVYAVTADAVIVYDRDRLAWLPPFTRDAGFDPSLVRALAIDPDDDSAWLLGEMGAWTLQPLTGFATRAPAGPPPRRLRSATMESVYREFPSLEGFASLLTRDDVTLRAFPVTAAARAPDRTEVWLGTAGGGLWQVDPLFNRAVPVPFGLASIGAGALARAADGVWVAPAPHGYEPRSALTFVGTDLQHWRWLDDAANRSFAGARATALETEAGALWMGTTRGLYRIPLDGGASPRMFTPMTGLPGDAVLSLLVRAAGVWVGTERGLASLSADSVPASGHLIEYGEVAGVPVRALLATGDTLWAGTDGGLVLRPPGVDARFVRPAVTWASSRLRQPVRALARADSAVYVALPDGVLMFSLRAGAWSEPWPAAPWRAVGEIGVLAADARSLWAGGAFGVVALDRATGGSRILRTGSDLPDAVTDILLDGAWAWIATLGGVVRVRRAADGLIH